MAMKNGISLNWADIALQGSQRLASSLVLEKGIGE
jgi:hypothetical protein